MDVPIRDFLKARRNRALGAIMNHVERHVYPRLSTDEQRKLRSVITEAINSYHDTVLDLSKTETPDTTLRNEEVFSLLERLEGHIMDIKG